MKKKYIILSVMIVILLAIDLLTKYFLTDVYDLTIIPGVVSFDYTTNTGASFSIFSEHTVWLTVFSAVMVVAIVVVDVLYRSRHPLYVVSIGLVMAGAVGNLIDRLAFGYVRDFIRLDFVNFAIFNFADCCLTVGCVCLAVYILFFSKNKGNNDTK